MRINSVKKLYEALKFAREKDEQARQNLKQGIFKAYAKLDKGEIEKAKEVLEDIYQQVNQEGPQSLTHSITSCFERVASWEVNATERGVEAEYIVGSEYGEHCMFFSERYASGDCGLCGGIIFHGSPEEGYKENGSVSLNPQYGWQIHT